MCGTASEAATIAKCATDGPCRWTSLRRAPVWYSSSSGGGQQVAQLPISGTDLSYEERGQGTPILWLQGLGADHTAWAPQLARFASHYRCLAPDNRGAGHTVPGKPFSLRTLAEDAVALLDARAPGEPAHLVGLSMGASIAQELALGWPDRVRSLTLVSAFARVEPRVRELLLAWRAIYPRVPTAAFQRQANAWLFSWRFFERPGAVDAVIAYAERQSPPSDWFVAQIDASLAHDATDRLPSLSLPALVIAGAEDALTPPRLGRGLAALVPGARFLEIAEAGHSVNLEQQRPFNEALLAFFEAH